MGLALVILIISLALVYDFLNGANDRANAIATVVATKALTPLNALVLASFFNLLGALISTEVAKTIGKGIVSTDDLAPTIFLLVLVSGLCGAILWTFLCTIAGIPMSVTHALIGGLIGAGVVAGGTGVIQWEILREKVFFFIVLGPLIGFLAGALLFAFVSWMLYLFFKTVSPFRTEELFKKLQTVSASFMAFSHGMNDTQNAMGVITAALIVSGLFLTSPGEFIVPWWVKILCGTMMALGTLLMGQKVMETLGWRLARLEAKHGFSAETGAGLAIVGVSLAGMPVSTTHIIGSAVIGGTFFQSLRRIRWSEVGRMVTAWVITIPITALIGGVSYELLQLVL